MVLLLSNGDIPCSLPTAEDAREASLDLLELSTAVCREGARHVALDLVRADDWVVQSAWYYAIEEAVVRESAGLVQTTEGTDVIDLRDLTGSVDLELKGREVRGSFRLPRAHVEGRFRAGRCPEGSAIFQLIQIRPAAICP